ncbi:NERD domain-containing protein [Chloroflexota bacterium]
MKLIDHTPYLTEKGELSLWHKFLGTLRYGDFWVEEINAQQEIIEELDRTLAPGYTLLRNIQLPGSKFMFPMILVGPAGVFMLTITTMKGNYHAIEGSWKVEKNGKIKPARPNLMRDNTKMAMAVQKFLEKFGIKKGTVEGVLIASNLAMYINKENPIVRIVMRDTIGLLSDDLNQSDAVLDINNTTRIVDVLTDDIPIPEPEVEKIFQQDVRKTASLEGSADPNEDLEESKIDIVEDQPLKFGDESTPWNLMEDFDFDPGEDDELPADVPQVPIVEPIIKTAAKLKLTPLQWIVIGSAVVVVLYLLVFIFRTIASML